MNPMKTLSRPDAARAARRPATRAALAGALLALAAGCGHKTEVGGGQAAAEAPDRPPVVVQVAEARQTTLPDEYVATATVRGRTTATITAKGMGYVRALTVKAGDTVQAGQLLVELDSHDVQAGLMQAKAGASEAEAALVQAERDVEAAKAARKLTQLTWERTQRLAEQKAATQQQLDEAEMAKTAAEARERMAEAGLARARAGVGQAQAGVGLARVSLDDRKVVAPFAGRVVSRSVEVGNLASPGTPLLTLEEAGALRVEAVVDESQTARIHMGDAVRVDIDALQSRLSGTVGEIVPTVDAASRAFLVKVDLPADAATDTTGALRPGMFARARFAIGQRERLTVPVQAVSARGQLDRVFVAENGRARLRLITVGARYEEQVEVLSGLDAGERVVVAPGARLLDATPIAVAQ